MAVAHAPTSDHPNFSWTGTAFSRTSSSTSQAVPAGTFNTSWA